MRVHDLIHCPPIWQHLEPRFNIASLASPLYLKHMLLNLDKPESQPMDEYLRQNKSITDALATIKPPVSDWNLFNTLLCR